MKRIFLLLFLGSLSLQAQESAPGSPQGEARGGEFSFAALDWSALCAALKPEEGKTEEQRAAEHKAEHKRLQDLLQAKRLREARLKALKEKAKKGRADFKGELENVDRMDAIAESGLE